MNLGKFLAFILISLMMLFISAFSFTTTARRLPSLQKQVRCLSGLTRMLTREKFIVGGHHNMKLKMNLNCGIVGLPNVGKSTLFNALVGSEAAQAANFPFCTIGIIDIYLYFDDS